MDYREINRRVIEQYRAGGDIEGMHRDRLLLLTTTGARTGQRHTTPMMYHRDGDRILVIASNAGSTRHPDWYVNLAANPAVTVEVGDEKFDARASTTQGDDRSQSWAVLKDAYPFFAEHEVKAGREIPVVALTRQ